MHEERPKHRLETDADSLAKALERTRLKQSKALIKMEGSAVRDNIIFNLDAQYIEELKREKRLRNFNLQDYLPNTLKRHRHHFSPARTPVIVGEPLSA